MNEQQLELTAEQRAIADAEYDKYKHVWENCATYGDKHHDANLWDRQGDMMGLRPGDSVIVLGCGDGTLVEHFVDLGYEVKGIDIFPHDKWAGDRWQRFAATPLWEDIPAPIAGGKWDIAICADVMEHIPPELLLVVLARINGACSRVLFQIANMDSYFDGHDLHLIKEDASWWVNTIMSYCSGLPTIVDHDESPAGRFVIDYHGI